MSRLTFNKRLSHLTEILIKAEAIVFYRILSD